MPFDRETAAAAGKKGGKKGGKASAAARWGGKDPSTIRNKNIRLAVSQDELDIIDHKAADAELSRVELIVRAVRKYDI